MSNIVLLKGEVWKTRSLKGELTVRLLEDVDPESDKFFDAELVEGTPKYLSRERESEALGETISMRTNMTQFIRRLFPKE